MWGERGTRLRGCRLGPGRGWCLGLLFPDDIGGDQGKSAGGVVLWAHVHRNCLCFFEPRLEVDAWFVGKRRGEGSEFQLSHDGEMDGWMDGWVDGWKDLISTVDPKLMRSD